LAMNSYTSRSSLSSTQYPSSRARFGCDSLPRKFTSDCKKKTSRIRSSEGDRKITGQRENADQRCQLQRENGRKSKAGTLIGSDGEHRTAPARAAYCMYPVPTRANDGAVHRPCEHAVWMGLEICLSALVGNKASSVFTD
jgi:hypothetical protein